MTRAIESTPKMIENKGATMWPVHNKGLNYQIAREQKVQLNNSFSYDKARPKTYLNIL